MGRNTVIPKSVLFCAKVAAGLVEGVELRTRLASPAEEKLDGVEPGFLRLQCMPDVRRAVNADDEIETPSVPVFASPRIWKRALREAARALRIGRRRVRVAKSRTCAKCGKKFSARHGNQRLCVRGCPGNSSGKSRSVQLTLLDTPELAPGDAASSQKVERCELACEYCGGPLPPGEQSAGVWAAMCPSCADSITTQQRQEDPGS